jgi:hypothetical protein
VRDVRCELYSLSFYEATPGFTDTNGIVKILLHDIYSQISGHFTKQGYYKSNGVFWKWGKWGEVPPADTNFTIVLKRIIEPVPMKSREVKLYAPRLGEAVGFDFEIGDLVFPDGKGKTADIFITTSRDDRAENDYTAFVNVEFAGEQNGLQPFIYPFYNNVPGYCLRSELPPPSIAPEKGYDATLECFVKCSPPSERARTLPPTHYMYNKNTWTGSYVVNRKWIFKTRTTLDEDGNIVAANYGWMTDEIRVFAKADSDGQCMGITLSYYYNPDPHSRSLEPKEIADRQNKN